jgi:hypothetical protein
MIGSATAFVALRNSESMEDQYRAAHESASLETWQAVVTDYPDMRFWVAQNKTVPVEILEMLAIDPDSRVRDMVARKRKLPHHLYNLLARDSSDSVRHAVACNAKVPRDVLEQLCVDAAAFVAEEAKRRLKP